MLFLVLACADTIIPFDAPVVPSAFEGADMPDYSIWPFDVYAYTRGDAGVAGVEMEWSYADPATRERFVMSPIPDLETGWELGITAESTVHTNQNDPDICATRLDAFDADGNFLDCMVQGEPGWVDAQACGAWILGT